MKQFQSFREWRVCVECATRHLLAGFAGVVRSVFVGIGSLLSALWRFLSRQVGKYPSAALGGFIVAVLITWVITFAYMRARAVAAEDRCSKLTYEYAAFREQHGFE